MVDADASAGTVRVHGGTTRGSMFADLRGYEELADALGSVREVLSRQLQRFQAEELLTLERGRVTLGKEPAAAASQRVSTVNAS